MGTQQAQTISEWLKKQMGIGVIPVSGFHVQNEHMMTRGKNRDRREVDPANATGKSIEPADLAELVKGAAQCSYRCGECAGRCASKQPMTR